MDPKAICPVCKKPVETIHGHFKGHEPGKGMSPTCDGSYKLAPAQSPATKPEPLRAE